MYSGLYIFRLLLVSCKEGPAPSCAFSTRKCRFLWAVQYIYRGHVAVRPACVRRLYFWLHFMVASIYVEHSECFVLSKPEPCFTGEKTNKQTKNSICISSSGHWGVGFSVTLPKYDWLVLEKAKPIYYFMIFYKFRLFARQGWGSLVTCLHCHSLKQINAIVLSLVLLWIAFGTISAVSSLAA